MLSGAHFCVAGGGKWLTNFIYAVQAVMFAFEVFEGAVLVNGLNMYDEGSCADE